MPALRLALVSTTRLPGSSHGLRPLPFRLLDDIARESPRPPPDDPRWKAQGDTLARRRRQRHLARLKELASELGAEVVKQVRPPLLAPSACESAVPSKPPALRGDELLHIIERDVHHILSQSGMFTGYIGYGRVAYEVRVTMHMDNPVLLDSPPRVSQRRSE